MSTFLFFLKSFKWMAMGGLVFFLKISIALLIATSAQAALSVQAEDAVKQFLDKHPSLEGRDFSIQWESTKFEFQTCAKAPSVELLRKDKAWGKLLLNVRCDAGKAWTRPVSLYVTVKGRYLALTRPMKAGQILASSDWKWVEGDLSKMGDNLVDDPEWVKDMELNRSQQPGNPLRLNDFRPMSVIKSGDQIRVTMRGRGFAIDSSGQALSDAALGASVKVRIADGKIIQGTAVSQGLVEVVME
jgi:flagella basal body P-ring formation protein FlgA